jgi:large subunit ribosomal protein L29
MKIKQLRELASDELHKKVLELRKELMKQNAQVATGTVPKSPGLIKLQKKSIAQIKTLLHERGSKKKV